MKHILFLLLFLPVLACAQFPANPNKIRLGNQTTADGLVVRTAAAPSWTPSTVNNAWLAFDTVAGVFYYYDAGTWNIFSSGGGIDSTQANNGLTMSGDTVQLGGTLTKNTEIDTDGKTLRFRDAAGYPDLLLNATYGVLSSDINTYLDIGSTAGRARIVASTTAQLTSAANTDVSATDTVTITGQRIRLNAADTRIQQVANDNALNRLVALDSLTGQLKYVDKASISGGGGGGVTGSGTTGTIPVWSSSTALGDSPLTVSSGSVTATGTGFFLPPVGTTAQRPGTPTAGMLRYNSSNGNLDFYGASAWENPVRSANGNGLGTANYVPFYDANGRLTGGNAGLRFITTPYSYIQYGQSTLLTDNTLFYWFNGNENSRTITNNYGTTRNAETGAWRVVVQAAGAHAFDNFQAANAVAFTSPGHAGGSVLRGGSFWAYNGAGSGSATVVGVRGKVDNYSTSGAASMIGFLSEVTNGAGTATVAYGGSIRLSNSATITNTYGWHVGDITSGTQTNTPRSFYATDGNAINVLHGRTRINADAAPSQALHVTGKIQADTLNDTGASIAGFTGTSGAGVLTRLALGSGLSLTSGTLSSTVTDTHIGNTNLSLTGNRTLTQDTSSLTMSGTKSNITAGVTIAPGIGTTISATNTSTLKTAYLSATPEQVLSIAVDVLGGKTGYWRVYPDSITVSPATIIQNDTLSNILAMTQSGRIARVAKSTLTGLSDPGSNGMLARTSANTTTARTITAGAGITVTNGDGVSGNPAIARTYSLVHNTISGGSTFCGTTAERPDNDTPGSVTTNTIGSDFSVSGSTIDYTGANGALLRISGTVSFSVSDDVDIYLSIYEEGSEIAATSTRTSCTAGAYYTIPLPETTTTGNTNDTFEVRIATSTGNTTTTMHRYGIYIERIY